MLTTREVIKTFYNALIHKLKKYRGNWDQNDPTAADYIKNRPFYSYGDKNVVILPEQTVFYETNLNSSLEIGETYIVTYDGVDYETVCWSYGEYRILGDAREFPFALEVYRNELRAYLHHEEREVAIKIVKKREKVKKIDPKYIPDLTLPENVLRPDYDIYDQSEVGYIRNRPCYLHQVAYVNTRTNDFSLSKTITGYPYVSSEYPIIPGQSYMVEGSIGFHYTIKGENIGRKHIVNFRVEGDAPTGGFSGVTILSKDKVLVETPEGIKLIFDSFDNTNVYFYYESPADIIITSIYFAKYQSSTIYLIKQLDERMLPDTIARTYNIPTIDATLSITGAAADAKIVGDMLNNTSKLESLVKAPKDTVSFIDQVNGYTYIACMRNGNFVTYCGTKSIEVTTMPLKTEYMVGECFDPSGLIISAITYDGEVKENIDYTYQNNPLTEDTTFISIKYVEGGIEHTTTVPVNMVPFDPAIVLVDFSYVDNGNGTYTIVGWNGTYNGEPSTELIIPNNGCIIV